MAQHGFPAEQILDHIEKFDEETKAEQEKCESNGEFNENILKSKDKEAPLARVCKGVFVGNIFLKYAREENHDYLLAKSKDFIIIVPFGPIQSVIHTLAIPKVPIYNVVSLGMDSVTLVQRMQAALVKVVTDVLNPDSLPQKLYLRALSQGIDKKSTDRSNIRITQEGNDYLDTINLSGAEASEIFRLVLIEYYSKLRKSGVSIKEVVSTDLHVHPTNSVGQIHMHGWIAEPELITDNGMKLKSKNTPLDRILPVLSNFRGGRLRNGKKFKVTVTNKSFM